MTSKKSKIHQKSEISECAQKSKAFSTFRKFENSFQIKAILFDMDGVLIESHDAWVYIFNKAYQKFENKQISVEDFDKHIWAKAFEKIAKVYFTVPESKIREYFNEIYEDYRQRLKIIVGTVEALTELKNKGIRLVVVSNTQKKIIGRILKDTNLLEFFEFFLGGDDVTNGKPNPDILYKALEILKLEKDDVLFVGDTIWDKQAAKNGNIKFIGFKQDGDKKINNLKELIELI